MSQNERISFIHQSIKMNGKIALKQVCDRFEVNERTAKRDIEYMRDRLNAPIEFSYAEHAYLYKGPFDRLDYLDERVLLFYTLVEKLAENHDYLPFVSKDVLDGIRRYLLPRFRPLLNRISYELTEAEDFDIQVFQVLTESFLSKKSVRFSYLGAGSKQSHRTAEPLHLLNYSGRWYCIAYDTERKDLRQFFFSRISGITLTDSDFKNSISDASLNNYLKGTFGIFKGEMKTRLTVRFFEPVYFLVKEERWHPEQTLTEGTDASRGKYCDITLPVHDYTEILGKILRYGPKAEAIQPEDFRNLWKSTIEQMYNTAFRK